MPEPLDDPFLNAAIRLGFLKTGEAQKAAREAVRSGQKAEEWLLGRGTLTPREVERVKRLAGLGRRPTTRSGATARTGASGGFVFAILGFVLVLGVGIFLFKDRILGPTPESPDPATVTSTQPEADRSPPVPAAQSENAAEKSAGKVPESEPAPETGETRPLATPATSSETGKEPAEPKKPGEEDEPATRQDPPPEKPAPPPPPRRRRDPEVLQAGHTAFECGEKLNAQVGEAEGTARLDIMEKALAAYTEALTQYREYAGSRVPMHLEQRYAEVNNRIAILRKLMPPERAARYINRLTDRNATAVDLLARADSAYRESPLNHTLNYMLYQRVLDEHPHSPEAIHALRRIGEIGWREIVGVSSRKTFHRRLEEWKKAMRAGHYELVQKDLAEVQSNDTVRQSMQRVEWNWHQTMLRALRAPKAALHNLIPGEVIRLKKRGGGQVKGKVEEILPFGVRLEKNRVLRVGELDPREIARLAFPDKLKGSDLLTLACFLSLSGSAMEGVDALDRADRLGIPIDDYETPIRRLEYEEKQNHQNHQKNQKNQK